ncbi:MAG TPA: acetyl-CoA carboxylase biotin carboxylase subunit [Bacteroidota bacterium]|nr:acetyl-CoA carboxylase biotin carboxylase subunit [Bacteroidota bacterium]
MIKKILIANRGEIALRVIRACRELNISTVAVYSLADKYALHVRFADEAVCIGPPQAKDSYLNIPQLMAAAEVTGSDAIHPGYGFLAENAAFAEICISSGLNFIGPKPNMISTMGDKALAKSTVKKMGVPVIPGSDGPVNTFEEAIKIANEIGFPIILKASAGGGGRGMRVVNSQEEMENAFLSAQNEAEKAFSNKEVYLEKFIVNPHHVEVQILGDQHGNIIHLGERDCSIQRRHQKLIEETPSPAINSETREKICEAAILAAKSVNYESCGTVEFLVDENGNFYFMEMNTRIQVEHPVTEEVYGIDLVKEQIRVADGEKIETQNVCCFGHAMECRINAEDPDYDFRPSTGKITSFHTPGGFGVRVDTHAYAGYEISQYYDSLIAKLIVRGKTREEVLNKMGRALDEFVIEGIKTTIPFQTKIINDPNFRNGNFDIGFIERNYGKVK